MVLLDERSRSQLADGPDTFFPYQEEAVRKIIDRGGSGGLFMDRRTGKSWTALEVANRLQVDRILVVAPISAVGGWNSEIHKRYPAWAVIDAASRGSVAYRAGRIPKHYEATFSQMTTVAIVGFESYWHKSMQKAIEQWRPEMIIYDEGHRLIHRGTRQSREAHRLRNHVTYVLNLSGTQFPTGRENAFSIYKATDTSVFGTRWADFAERYLVYQTRYVASHSFQEVVAYQNTDEFDRKLAESSYHISKAEAWEFLPESVDNPVEVDFTPKSRKVYNDMRKDAIAEIEGLDENGEPYSGRALALLVLTKLIRLQQMTSGFVKAKDDTIVDLSSEKLDAVYDLCSDILPDEKKVVVYAAFRRDLQRLAAHLAPLGRVYAYDGKVAKIDRPDIQAAFQADPGPAIFVCQIKTTEGLDLSSSPSAIFYSADFRLVNFLQATDRLHHPKRRLKPTYHYVAIHNSVDQKVYNALRDGEDTMNTVLAACRGNVDWSAWL